MSADVQVDVRELFFAALDCHSPEELERFLDTECFGQPEVRERLEALLGSHRDCGNFIDGSRGARHSLEPLVNPGTIIDRFRILALLGEGGFGVVYLAEQFEPVMRQVALKVIRPGMDTGLLISRFQGERQALALMDHPNIAQVYDGGTTPCGRPYVVMELVTGLSITEYCDAQQLNIRKRLSLFIDVCRAVHHAHQKGLIHCDLKPSNVLVMTRDDEAVVKVIDFGIAKVLKAPIGEGTESAAIAALQGSPNYMSPEQWPQSGMDVDTRSDVYALGVLLFQILTGTTPFQRNDWASTKWDKLYRSIRDEAPSKPSQQFDTASADAKECAEARSTTAKRLSHDLRGELDWIVLKSLAPDRRQRFDSAGALADDLERYLQNGYVHAAPPSNRYRLGKLLQRNRAVLGMAALILICLVTTTVISLGAAIRARRAEEEANRQLLLQQAAAARAENATAAALAEQVKTEHQRQRAETNLQQARAMVDRVLQHLSRANLSAEADIESMRRDILRDSLEFFQEFLLANASDPRLRSDLAKTLMQIASAHANLSEWSKAVEAHRSAIDILTELSQKNPGVDSYRLQLADARLGLAGTYRVTCQELLEADTLYREGLRTYESLVAPQHAAHPESWVFIERLAEYGHFLGFSLGRRTDAEPYLSRALALGRRIVLRENLPENQIRLAAVCNTLGILYRQSLTPARAPELHRESIQLLEQAADGGFTGDLRIEMSRSYSHLGMAKIATADLAGAEIELERAIDIRQELVSERPKDRRLRMELALSEMQLAGVLQSLGRLEDAEREMRQSAAIFEALAETSPRDVSIDHIRIDICRRLGDLLCLRGDRAAAAEQFQSLRSSPVSSAASADGMAWHLANCPLVEYRDVDHAIELAKSAVEGNPAEGLYWSTLGCAQFRSGDFQNSIRSLQKSQQLVADRGDSIPGFLLAMARIEIGDHAQARADYQQALGQFRNRPTWMSEDDAVAIEAAEYFRDDSTARHLQ